MGEEPYSLAILLAEKACIAEANSNGCPSAGGRSTLRSYEKVGREFSLIPRKNALLHFEPSQRVEAVRMLYRVSTPGGAFVAEQVVLTHGHAGQLSLLPVRGCANRRGWPPAG